MQYLPLRKNPHILYSRKGKTSLFNIQNGGVAYDCIEARTQTKNNCRKAERNDFIMKKFENTIIIGIDHGFGNIKTASHIFPSGVKCDDELPAIISNLRFMTKNIIPSALDAKNSTQTNFQIQIIMQ